MTLKAREKRFIAEYCIDLSASAAARRAGYSESYARTARLIKRPEIAAAIRDTVEPMLARAGISAERVLREAARIAFADPRKFARPDGSVCPLQELDADTAGAVAALRLEERPDGHRVLRLRCHDKISALVLLGRQLGLYRGAMNPASGDAVIVETATAVTETSSPPPSGSATGDEFLDDFNAVWKRGS